MRWKSTARRSTSGTRSCTTAHVVETLAKAGAVFVDETDEVPEGAIVVFSAHGVAPTVHATAAERQLKVIDATCPLVTKVHNEAKRFARDDYDILLIGHEGHEEVVGTAGEAPDHVQLVDGPGAVDSVTVRDENKVIWLSQTTLSRRRDDGDRAAAAGALPETAGSTQRRHLLRDPESPGRGQGDGARVRAGDRRRVAQLVELGAAGRGRVGRRVGGRAPGRLRRGHRPGLAGRCHHGRGDVRRIGARGAGARRAGAAGRARLRRGAAGDDGQRDAGVRAAAGDQAGRRSAKRRSPRTRPRDARSPRALVVRLARRRQPSDT